MVFYCKIKPVLYSTGIIMAAIREVGAGSTIVHDLESSLSELNTRFQFACTGFHGDSGSFIKVTYGDSDSSLLIPLELEFAPWMQAVIHRILDQPSYEQSVEVLNSYCNLSTGCITMLMDDLSIEDDIVNIWQGINSMCLVNEDIPLQHEIIGSEFAVIV